MISIGSARALASTGLTWDPARGDRFVIADRDMDDDVFVLSDMTIETHDYRTGRVIGFNGTTEWALDSVDADDVLWLPGEGSMRALLGPAFVRLESAGLAGWSVTVVVTEGGETTVTDTDAEEAYALALLTVRATGSSALLPLAAHAVVARAGDLDLLGDRGWNPGLTGTLHALVETLRTYRAQRAGAAADEAGEQANLVEDADPVAEDRTGTLDRAVTAALRAPAAPTAGEGRERGGDDLLVQLVLAAHDLGSTDVAQVCVRRAVDIVRARSAASQPGPPSARAIQSVDAGLAELVALLRG